MKQLSFLLTLLFFLIHLKSEAQIDIRQDRRVDSLLKQVDVKRSGLIMFGRKADGGKYVNMAVLADSAHMLTWFTCYGQAFDAVRLTDDVYNRIKSGTLDPFNYYKDYFFDLFSYVKDAATRFRREGDGALRDTGSIYHQVYTYPLVQHARSTLQKEVAMEKIMSGLCLQLSLFDSKTPRQLASSDSFQLRLQLAGEMIRKGDTTIYYNTNPLSSAASIVLCKQVTGKMFVYDPHSQLMDSVPLKAGKYATLLNEKEDVFLLYRGWLDLQSQQAIAAKEEVARLLNEDYTMPYRPVYWEKHKRELQQTLSGAQEQVDAVGNRVIGLIMPGAEETAHFLAAIYQDKPTEISYLPGIGFGYSISYIRGDKHYELTNHLHNVMALVSDSKKGVDENGDGSVDYYNADVISAVDYLPFGAQMPGRTYSGKDKYRYGFNGKENDNEVKGEGNQQDYGMRVYDPRIGRFLSVDPLTPKYPELTPYQFASNIPIRTIDQDGLETMLPEEESRYEREREDLEREELHRNLGRESEESIRERERITREMKADPVGWSVRTFRALEELFKEDAYQFRVQQEVKAGKIDPRFAEFRKYILKQFDEQAAARMSIRQKTAANGGNTNAAKVNTESNSLTRVGRWMNPKEYEAMKATGRIQEGAGGTTFTATSGPASFRKQAAPGSVYVEFDVPTNSLLQGGQADWFKTIGNEANAVMKHQLKKQGGTMNPEVKNISGVIERK